MQNLLDEFNATPAENKKKRADLYQQYLVAHLYGGIHEPVRNEMATVRIVGREGVPNPEVSDTWNYIDTTSDEWFFKMNNYKTARVHGPLRLIIPGTLRPVISKWLEINATSSYFLIVPTTITADGGPKQMTPAYLSRYLARACAGDAKAKVGSRLLRKNFMSTKFGADLQERQETAARMGHSVSVAMLHYCRKRQRDANNTANNNNNA